MSGDKGQRIDKWLWFARVVKTRTLAQKLAVSGRVRVNREKNDSSSRLVKVGDTLTVTLEAAVRVLRVVSPGVRRGPPAEARLLYEDLSPPPLPIPRAHGARQPGAGRPTKRDRRAIERSILPRDNDFADTSE
jgi:ribosome-associated heat shock protein Hsp15